MNDSRVQILLVSPDLLAISRLSGLAKEANVHVETLRSLDAVPEGKQFNLVLLDIGSLSGDPATLLCSARDLVAIRGGPPIVTFGPHVAKDRFADAIAAVQRRHSAGEKCLEDSPKSCVAMQQAKNLGT